MGFNGLTVLVLQQVRERSVKCPGRTSGECRGMPAGLNAVAGCLESDQPYAWVIEKRMKNTNGIGPATNARDDGVRQPTGLTLDLHTCLHADDSLEIAHHGWKRMRSGRSTKAVVGVVGVGNPIPNASLMASLSVFEPV